MRKTLFDALYRIIDEIPDLASYGYIICTPPIFITVIEGNIALRRNEEDASKQYRQHLTKTMEEMRKSRLQDDELPF